MIMDKTAFCAVIVPTMGRPILIDTLLSLMKARGSDAIDVRVYGTIPDPVVKDRLDAFLLSHPQVRYTDITFSDGDLSRKKNLGLDETTAPIVAFIDDDLLIPEGWIMDMLAPFADPKVGMVCGPSLLPADLPLVARLAGQALASPAAGFVATRYNPGKMVVMQRPWSSMIGCNMACRRDALREAGGFLPYMIPGEDLVAAFNIERAGWKLVQQSRAGVLHYPRQSFFGFLRQTYRFGRARVRLIRYGTGVNLPVLGPACLVALVLLSAFLPLMPSSLHHAFRMCAMLYALLVLSAAAFVFAKSRRAIDFAVIPYIVAMHLAYGCGEWIELLQPNRDLSEARREQTREVV